MVEQTIRVENARIGFKNFSGAEGRFNPAGRRNFCVFFDPEMGEALYREGWNIKTLTPKEEGDDPVPYLQVSVSFDNIPPKIVQVTSRGKTTLDEETVGTLDWAQIQNVDLAIRPYNWSVNGKTGVKAYLKTMYVTLVEDEFESKYCDVPDSAFNAMPVDHA